MPDNLNQRLADELTRHDIGLLRVAAHDERELEAAIDALTAELVRRLIRRDPTAVGSAYRRARLDRLNKEARIVIRDAYREMYRNVKNNLVAIARNERGAIGIGVSHGLGISRRKAEALITDVVPRDVINGIIDNRVISANARDAATLREFFEREAANHYQRHVGTLRQAFAQDETITQMIQRLRELTAIQVRESNAVLRSSYNHVVSQLRVETMQRNAHLFRGVIAIVILDSHTSKVCMGRSRGMWDLNTGRPLPESAVKIPFPGPTPWHMNCRTQLYPLTRTASEIGAKGTADVKRAIESLDREQRELLSVDPPDNETYTQWLKRQSVAVQNAALGPTRRKLWLDGKIELIDLVTQRGRPLTLDQLKRRVA